MGSGLAKGTATLVVWGGMFLTMLPLLLLLKMHLIEKLTYTSSRMWHSGNYGLSQTGHLLDLSIPTMVHVGDLCQTDVYEGIGGVWAPVGHALSPQVRSVTWPWRTAVEQPGCSQRCSLFHCLAPAFYAPAVSCGLHAFNFPCPGNIMKSYGTKMFH